MMRWYTYKEVAQQLHVSVSLVRRWVRTGRLEVNRITHKTVRISQDSLDSFLAGKDIKESACGKEK